MLKCNRCGSEKEIEHFPSHNGISSKICKECVAHQRRAHYLNNKEHVLKRVALYRKNNKSVIRKKDLEYQLKNKNEIKIRRKELTVKNKEKMLWFSAKKRAKHKKLDFSIEIDDIIIPEYCPVLGIPLLRDNSIQLDNSPTLDRIDNTKGYIKGNVCVISNRANIVKNCGSIYEHLKVVEYMKLNGMD
jgi:hypothetical protein